MKHTANINDSSIESAGLPKDYREALAELIWNGFDARATTVDIRFRADGLGRVEKLVVADNGEGISYQTLGRTFGSFLDSVKRNSYRRSSYSKGKKGKGRFSFSIFATKATWHTVSRHHDKLIEYDLVIHKSAKNVYEELNKKVSKSRHTGTQVILEGLFDLSGYSFTDKSFTDYLAREFGWFLFLNREAGYALTINGEPVEYAHLIADSTTTALTIQDRKGNEHVFRINYVRWLHRIGDKYYYYFLNDRKLEVAKRLTSFNNNAIDFHHSVFVDSPFFNAFDIQNADADEENLFSELDGNRIFKLLLADLKGFLTGKQKAFIKESAAEKLVLKYEKDGVFPQFANNRYDQERKRDLVNVVKELYYVQPKLFKGLKSEQEKTFIGFLNLLLDTDERENILGIIDGVVRLSAREREELSNVLKKTTFSRIVETIKLIENRHEVIELLKTLVFDLTRFTTEREHVQRVVAENYWLFGEQYHLASADQNFQQLLSSYLYIIDEVRDIQEISSYDWKRRPDIFLCRKQSLPDPADNEYQIEENIIVELKRPSVTIGKAQFRQVDDYMDFIMREDRFNSQTRRWKFFVISNKVDDYIVKQYEAFKEKGKKFLVHQSGRYEIYALTWDDLFRTFEIRHRYLLDKLEFDRNAIQQELKLKGIVLNRESADLVAGQAVGKKEA